MPRLLKSETNRRLIASERSLALAFSLLSTPRAIAYDEIDSDGAIEIGLIGIAAELAITACLYEVYGKAGIIRRDTGFYLTAGEAFASFRKMLSSTIPRLATITAGVASPQRHLKELQTACIGFPVIFTARAAAVHAASGTSRDVAFHAGRTVAGFLLCLSESPKWKPYLKLIPDIPAFPKERMLIAQELATLVSSGEKSKVGASLAGVFLVLPELTKNEPEWIKTLQRVQVTPRRQDISVLLKTLRDAKIGDLHKVGKGVNAIAARIDPTNSNALPIYIEAMKKKFDTHADAWGGYVGTANGQLDRKILSLPPIEVIYSIAAVGVEEIGLSPEEISGGISAHSVWPFIAGALHYSGTKGPCFWALRSLKSGEIGQLSALLAKAAECSAKIKSALPQYLTLFEAVSGNKPAEG